MNHRGNHPSSHSIRFNTCAARTLWAIVFSLAVFANHAIALDDKMEVGAPPDVEVYMSTGYGGQYCLSKRLAAVDASGNRYAAGIFGQGTHGASQADLNPSPGIDSKTASAYETVCITRINADGTYGWSQIFGGTDNDNVFGICLSPDGGTLYATGRMNSKSVQIGGAGTAMTANPNGGCTAFIIALDASTGAPKTGFGTGGMQKFGGTVYSAYSGYGIEVANGNLYVSGDFSNNNGGYVDGQIGGTGYAVQGSGSGCAFVIALNATSGQPVSTFGLGGSGISYFGGANASAFAGGLTVSPNGTVVYSCGRWYGSNPGISGGTSSFTSNGGDGYIIAQDALTGDPVNGFGSNGVQVLVGDDSQPGNGSYGECIYGVAANSSTVYGVSYNFSTNMQIGQAGPKIATPGNTDGVVIALDAATGAAKTGFGLSGSGIQTIGGSNGDYLFNIVANETTVYASGYFTSGDCLIGKAGAPFSVIDTTYYTSSGLVVALDAGTGAGKQGFGLLGNGLQRLGYRANSNYIALNGNHLIIGGISDNSTFGVGNPGTIVCNGLGYIMPIDPGTGAGLIYAPTALTLSSTTIAENQPIGTTVAILSATDADPNAKFTYSLEATYYYPANDHFKIVGNELQSANVFSVNSQSSFDIYVRVTDEKGLRFDAKPTITVSPVTVSIVATTPVADESNGTTGLFTITRSSTSALPLSVKLYVYGTAVAGTDYVAIADTAVIAANELSTTITVTPIKDTNYKSQPYVQIDLANGTGYTLGATHSATVTINDPLPVPTITIAATTPTADESTAANGTFTLTSSISIPADVTVSLNIGGTAVSGTDFIAIASTVKIPANQTTVTISVKPVIDANYKTSTTVVLTLAGGSGYTVGTPDNATVTINDPAPPPVITLAVTAATASQATHTPGAFTINSNVNVLTDTYVFFTVIGTAVSDTDYDSIGGSVTIFAGQKTATLAINPRSTAQLTSTVTVTLANGSNYVLGGAKSGTVTITNQPSPTFTSPPTPSNTTPVAGEIVTFTANAGTNTTITWNFGDGTFTTNGSSVTHTYTNPGTYTVTITADNGNGAPTITQITVTTGQAGDFATIVGSIKFNFAHANKDVMALAGNITLPANFKPQGKVLSVDIGGYSHDFTLSDKAKGGDANNVISIVGKLKKGTFTSTAAKFVLAVKNQNLFQSFEVFGFTNETIVHPEPVDVVVIVSLDGASFLDIPSFNYKAKFHASGSATLNKLK